MCTAKINIGNEAPFCRTSGGYIVQPPAGAPPGTNSVASSSVKANGRIQKLKLLDRKSTRLNSSHANISYAVFCLKKKKTKKKTRFVQRSDAARPPAGHPFHRTAV